MIFLDTGYLLALLDPTDHLHGRAMAWSRHVHEPLLVTEYVLWELGNLLSPPPDRPRFHQFMDQLPMTPAIEVVAASRPLFAAGLTMHGSRPDKYWSLTDCISFHVMQDRGTFRALAYDHHFEQAGFEALLRRDPP